MFSIEHVHGKGIGIVASCDIKCGDIIIEDSPLLMTVITDQHSHSHSTRPAVGWEIQPCETCLQPCHVNHSEPNAYSHKDIDMEHVRKEATTTLPLRIPCLFCLSSCYCTPACRHTAQEEAFHLCPAQRPFMAALTTHPLYQNSPRFRLFCQAVSRAVAGNTHLLLRLSAFAAPVMRTATGPATVAIQEEFQRQAAIPITLLRAAFGLDCCVSEESSVEHVDACEDIAHTPAAVSNEERVKKFATVAGFEHFWRVCAANVQAVTQPAAFSTLLLHHFKLSNTETDTDTITNTKTSTNITTTTYTNTNTNINTNADTDTDTEADIQRVSSLTSGSMRTPTASLLELAAALPPSALRDSHGSALFPTLSRLNHSCQPNVVLQQQASLSTSSNSITGETGHEEGEEGVGWGRVVVCAQALHDILRGEELCISYLGNSSSRVEGRAEADVRSGRCESVPEHEHELEERYGFRCGCGSV